MPNAPKIDIIASSRVKKYYEGIVKRTMEQHGAAKKARVKGKDLVPDLETNPAMDLADRTEQIIGPKGVAKRFREIISKLDGSDTRRRTIYKIFKEIIEGKLGDIPDREKRLEQAIKTALMLETEGVVVAPLDGVPRVLISKNLDGTEYVDIYFAGPIRAAGGSATVIPLILGDYARKLMGLDRYKPLEKEVERYVEEAEIYEEIFTRQYKIKADEVRKIINGCPVCINGEPTEKREVSVNRNLERVETNRVRGGACLVICEGVALKAMKIMSEAKDLGLDWGWLEGIIKVSKGGEEKKKLEPNWKYLGSMAAGRPIFSYPSRIGGFRLRYGRGRNTGIMAKAIHPAAMYLLGEFIAVGTQLKVERPGKSAGMLPCDSIEGPITRLKSGEVRQLKSSEEALKYRAAVDKILFLGDYLISYGDFRHSSHPLVPPGYCEEWWVQELGAALKAGKTAKGIDIDAIMKNPKEVDCFTAIELSMQAGVPLHPKYLHYYNALDMDGAKKISDSLKGAETVFEGNFIVGAELENDEELKKLLEDIGLPHKVKENKIVVGKEFAYPLLKTFGALSEGKWPAEGALQSAEGALRGAEGAPSGQGAEKVLDALSKISGITIRDKGGTFIGARMGRPEAAKPRKMQGNPHTLFPIGLYGGSIRSINKAADAARAEKRGVQVEVAVFKCGKCGEFSPYPYCRECNSPTKRMDICTGCGEPTLAAQCGKCGSDTKPFGRRRFEVDKLLDSAARALKVRVPETVKGVKGMFNDDKVCEPLEKGILRAYHDLHIFRDGTIRYEMLNAPLTYFKPREAGVSVERLRELGYEKDMDGRELTDGEQILELMPQDIVINEDAGDFFVRVCRFVNDLLVKFYGEKPYYNIDAAKGKDNLVGELLLSLAPHTSAAVVGRVVGFTKAKVNFGHPYMHLARRRNADGEQDSFMLLMDAMLNFSQRYLSSSRGGRMDAPLVFTMVVNPSEIDDEAFEMETCSAYPLEFYETAMRLGKADIASVERVENKLGKEGQYEKIGFTHNTKTFDEGPKISQYIRMESMSDKIGSQARLQGKIAAVDNKDALERVLASHFLPDIIGNARAFSRQSFRCTNCNTKYRRIPLSGNCSKCRKGNIILTIAQGSVRKYLEIAKKIIRDYRLSDYLDQRIALTEQEIDSIFTDEKKTQKGILDYM